MPSITLTSSFTWGIDHVIIAEGDGLVNIVAPQVVEVLPVSRNRIKVVFDKEMLFDSVSGGLLNPQNYVIKDHEFDRPIYVIRAEQFSDTTVLLTTQDHEDIIYDLKAERVLDLYGTVVDPAHDSAQYLGISPGSEFPAATNIYTFLGLYGGLESSEDVGISPDATPPYITDRSPAPAEAAVDKDKIITFAIKDDGYGVNLLLTRVYINGALAYDGPSDSWIAPYNGIGSLITGDPASYAVAIDKISSYSSFETVTVRVVAADKRPTPNYLDTSWSFTIEDLDAPVLSSQSPTGIGASRDTLISFTIGDMSGSGINLSSLSVSIDTVPAVVSGVVAAPFDGPGSSITPNAIVNGFDVILDATYSYPSFRDIYVVVSAQDVEGNSGGGSWAFRIEDYEGPLVVPVSPLNGEEGVALNAAIIVRLEEDQAIASGSSIIEVDINGAGFEVAYEDGGTPEFKPGWDGPGSVVVDGAKTKTVTIDPVSTYPYAATVTVRVTSLDVDGNPERI